MYDRKTSSAYDNIVLHNLHMYMSIWYVYRKNSSAYENIAFYMSIYDMYIEKLHINH